MKAKDIFFKTMVFNWMKLGLGAATVVISLVLGAVFVLIGGLLFGETGGLVGIVLWLIGTVLVHSLLNLYIGYLVKAGHIAMIMTAVTTGSLPENQFASAKDMVIKRFGTANVYFAIDRLVSGAVSQLQHIVTKAGDLMSFIPGMQSLASFANMFIGISLGYVDECCLAWTFYKQEENAFKSAADGVAIYYQNWKKLLKDALGTAVMVIVFVVAAVILSFAVFGGLFALLRIPGVISFGICCVIALSLKYAFIDSWVLVKTMCSYMEVAPSTVITVDLYGKLCGLSSKFKDLWGKATGSKAPVTYTAPHA